MSLPSQEPQGKAARKLRTFDDDDIVRYAMGMDVPIVGLVRDRGEYKEMREMALICGATLGIGNVPRDEAAEEEPAADTAPEEAPVAQQQKTTPEAAAADGE